MSPNEKKTKVPDTAARSLKKKVATKARTGVVKALRNEYPMSTNISSPVKGATKRRLAQYQYTRSDEDEDDDDAFDENPRVKTSRLSNRPSKGYRRDGFVVSDEINPDDFEDDDGIFAPVREAGGHQRKRKNSLPPRITVDEKMQSLNPTHRSVVDEFLYYAREESKKLLLARGLRAAPFTDTVLTEMAIRFPRNKEEMLQIPDIDPDKVELYHSKFLPLVSSVEARYHELMAQVEDRPDDPNHRNVVDLVSDDDDDPAGEAVGSSQEEQSSYFHQPNSGAAADFNKQMQELQSNRLAQRAKPKAPAPPDDTEGRRYRGGSQTGGKRPSFKKSYRKSGGNTGEGGPSRHLKKKGSTVVGARKTSASTNPARPTTAQRTFTGGGIGMMPT